MLASVSEPNVSFATLDPDRGERFQLLRRELDVSAFGINLLVLEPRQRGRIHAHEHQEEVYLVLEGELTLMLEREQHVVGANQLARVAAPARRQLVNAGRERLVLLALGGSGEHAGRDGRAWASWEEDGPGAPPQEVPLPEDLPA
jgi:mannose-6-phosphate isomerase-like protein (cupin superfamily)